MIYTLTFIVLKEILMKYKLSATVQPFLISGCSAQSTLIVKSPDVNPAD